jgi:hydrogenase small subunit
MSIPEDVPVGISKRTYLTIAGVAKTFHIKRLEGKLIDNKKDD